MHLLAEYKEKRVAQELLAGSKGSQEEKLAKRGTMRKTLDIRNKDYVLLTCLGHQIRPVDTQSFFSF